MARIQTDATTRSAQFYVTDPNLDVKKTLDELAKKNPLAAEWSLKE